MNFNEQMRQRTKDLVLDFLRWYRLIPRSGDFDWVLGKQLLRSITSVGANFRATCRARSDREYFAKLCIVVEEADESLFWMECFLEVGDEKYCDLKKIYQECREVLFILAKAKKNAGNKLKTKKNLKP